MGFLSDIGLAALCFVVFAIAILAYLVTQDGRRPR